MNNRKIRHLYVKNFAGNLYVPTDLQTPENIQLINDNKQAHKVISRFSKMASSRYWRDLNQGKTIITPKHF